MKKYYLIFGLILIGALIFYFWHQSFYLDWHLRPFGILMSVSGYKIVDYDEFIFRGNKNVEVFAKKGDNILRLKIIKNIDEKTAKEYIDDIFYKLEVHFDPKEILGIYADLVDAVAKVPEELKPKREKIIINDEETPCFIAFADKYFSYLVMTDGQAFYKGILTMIYCSKKKNLVNIEILTPKGNFNLEKLTETLKTFKCK